MNKVTIGERDIKLEDFESLMKGSPFSLTDDLKNKIQSSSKLLNKALEAGKTIYGVNTGYGYNCTNLIDEENILNLQENLVTYLRCGTGKAFSYKESKAIGFARFISVSKGLSGVSLVFIKHFKTVLSCDYAPMIPKNGSLGASGDLIPLAYWANFLRGQGEAIDKDGTIIEASDIFEKEGWSPYILKAKEGLSVVNGTSAMAGLAYSNFVKSQNLVCVSSILTSWAVMSIKGWSEAFSPLVNEKAKDFKGQAKYAKWVRALLEENTYESGSSADVKQVGLQTERALQDRYSIRCAPQIMGPFLDSMNFGKIWVEKEINGVSDNPLFDSDTNEIAMGGNFYGGYIGQLMDYFKISMMQLADMLDRQLLLVMDGYTNNGLSTNLVSPALEGFEKNMNHGLKGLHQSASAITSEIAALCIPNTIFSRSSETHNQDKVSLGLSACKQYSQILDLTYELSVLSAVCLCQALDIRKAKPKGTSRLLYDLVRKRVPFVDKDTALTLELRLLVKDLKGSDFREHYDSL